PQSKAPNAFVEGMFLAITPKKDNRSTADQPEPPVTSPEWPQIGTPEDTENTALIKALGAAATLEKQIEFCTTNFAKLGKEEAWAGGLADRVAQARQALADGDANLFWARVAGIKGETADLANGQLARMLDGKMTRCLEVEAKAKSDRKLKGLKARQTIDDQA